MWENTDQNNSECGRFSRSLNLWKWLRMKIIQNLFGEFFQENKIEVNPSRPNSGRREKINLNFHFHTSLWDLKRFYEGLKCLHKTF